jgi:hypothetical protein
MEWFRYFFGTPRRCVTTLIVLGLIIVMVFPGLLYSAVNQLLSELMPLLGPALTIVIVIGGLRMILFGRSSKK